MARDRKTVWGTAILLVGGGLLAFCGPAGPAGGDLVGRAAGAPAIDVTVAGVKPNGPIPGQFAFCVAAAQGHVTLGPNKNPEVSWSKGPSGTESYAVIVVDPDVPSTFDAVNKEGQTILPSLRRINFYHWILVDIPGATTSIPAGADSRGVTPHGQKPGMTKYGNRGVNDYGFFFASNPAMKGDYGGYDGPCPPWNDEIPHHYHFMVYALNVSMLALHGKVDGPEALRAMENHILAVGEAVGLYALNPDIAKRIGMK